MRERRWISTSATLTSISASVDMDGEVAYVMEPALSESNEDGASEIPDELMNIDDEQVESNDGEREKYVFISYKDASIVAICKFFLIESIFNLLLYIHVYAYALLWHFSDSYVEEEYIRPLPETLEDNDMEDNQDEHNS